MTRNRPFGLLLLFFVFLSGCNSSGNTSIIESTPTTNQAEEIVPTEIESLEPSIPPPHGYPDPRSILGEGEYVVFWDENTKKIQAANISGSQIIDWFQNETQYVSISPSGKKLIIGSFESMLLVQFDLKTETELVLDGIRDYREVTWSPNEEIIIFSGETVDDFQSVFAYSLITQDVVRITPWESIEGEPAWSPDGNWIAIASDQAHKDAGGIYLGQTEIFLLPATCLDTPEECSTTADQITGWNKVESSGNPSWSPDSKSIVFSCRIFLENELGIEQRLCLQNIRNWPDAPQLIEIAGEQVDSTWGPNNDWIAFTSIKIDENYTVQKDVQIMNLLDGEITDLTSEIEGNQEALFWLSID